MNVFETIKLETEGRRDKTAVIEAGYSVSYGRLLDSAEGLASVLREKGVASLDRVGLVCDNSIDYITVSLAVLSISAVIVPVSPEHTIEEIDDALMSMKADFVIFKSGPYRQDGAERLAFFGGLIGDDFYLLRRKRQGGIQEEYSTLNPAFIRFSSGTTGECKGVLLSHESIIERTDAADRGLNIVSDDNVLWVLSMSFHFVVTILLFLRRRATIVICRPPLPESLKEGVEKHRGTFLYASPFHYNLLLRSELFAPDSLKNIRLAVSTASKLPGSISEDFHNKFGLRLTEAYGIIEVGLPFINLTGRPGTVGSVLPMYEVRISGQNNDGVGEICIRGKGMLDAYFLPWQNKDNILQDGWFRTGDLGRLDSEGFLTIVGRKKNVINFTGMKVFPIEVETVINQYPGIKESYVYGEDHPIFGQLPMAKVVLKQGANGEAVIEALRRFCYQKLAQYKVPKSFQIVNDLPKTKSGKLKR